MKLSIPLMAAAAALLLSGCGPTMPVKGDDRPAPEVSAAARGPVGIPVKAGETSVKPFLAALGAPAREARIAEDHVVAVYFSNRIGVLKDGETPVIVVLPPDDARLKNLKPKALWLDLKKTPTDWVIQGLRLGNPEDSQAQQQGSKKPLPAAKLERAQKLSER